MARAYEPEPRLVPPRRWFSRRENELPFFLCSLIFKSCRRQYMKNDTTKKISHFLVFNCLPLSLSLSLPFSKLSPPRFLSRFWNKLFQNRFFIGCATTLCSKSRERVKNKTWHFFLIVIYSLRQTLGEKNLDILDARILVSHLTN